MHDWQARVSERLGNLRLCPETRSEVVRELAAHFEDIYDEGRAAGLSDGAAQARALASVEHWGRFRRDIRGAKETLMTTIPWKRQVLWPGMVALILSGLCEWLIYITRINLGGNSLIWHVTWLGNRSAAVFYLPWLLALPLVGAAAACLARRNGASRAQRALVTAFPALLNLALFLLVLALTLAFRIDAHVRVADKLVAFGVYMIPWVLAPAACGLIGALPFLSGTGSHPEARTLGASA